MHNQLSLIGLVQFDCLVKIVDTFVHIAFLIIHISATYSCFCCRKETKKSHFIFLTKHNGCRLDNCYVFILFQHVKRPESGRSYYRRDSPLPNMKTLRSYHLCQFDYHRYKLSRKNGKFMIKESSCGHLKKGLFGKIDSLFHVMQLRYI